MKLVVKKFKHFGGAVKKSLFSFFVCIVGCIAVIVLLECFKICTNDLLFQFFIGTWASILANTFWSVSDKYKDSLVATKIMQKKVIILHEKFKLDFNNNTQEVFKWCTENISFMNTLYNDLGILSEDLSYQKDFDALSSCYYEMLGELKKSEPDVVCFSDLYKKLLMLSYDLY